MTELDTNIKDKLDDFISSANGHSNEGIEVLQQLEAIFNVIISNSEPHTDINKLAKAGAYIAMDKANVLDCWREDIFNNIKEELSA